MARPITYPFTNRTYVALAIARGIAASKGHSNITAAHIALGIVQEGANIAAAALHRAGIHPTHLRHQLEAELPPDGIPYPGELDLPATVGEHQILEAGETEAAKLNDPYLGAEHLLLAMLFDPTPPIAQLFSRNGITYDTALKHLQVLRAGGV
jgi:ATP-dependent Clp protease ATP-binding subunit ClpB